MTQPPHSTGGSKRKRADSARDSQSRKRTRPEDLLCPAWVLTVSNTHVANDRAWFGDDYRPISSFLMTPVGPDASPVIGIGTVRLPVKISPDADNRKHGTITLRNVLHAPGALCNMIGQPFHDDYSTCISFGHRVSQFHLDDGTPAGFFFFKTGRFLQLRLSGPPVGPRVGPWPFEPDCAYCLRGDWPDAERDKWLLPNKPRHVLDRPSSEERRWLKTNYGNEFKFLVAHCLKIYNDWERQQGLELMRAMMRREYARAHDSVWSRTGNKSLE